MNGDSFNADKPLVWSDARLAALPRGVAGITGRSFDLSPDGERFAIAPARVDALDKQDRVVFIFNFFDELRRIAPAMK